MKLEKLALDKDLKTVETKVIQLEDSISSGGGDTINQVDILTNIMVGCGKEERGTVGTKVYVENFTDPNTFILTGDGVYDETRAYVYIP